MLMNGRFDLSHPLILGFIMREHFAFKYTPCMVATVDEQVHLNPDCPGPEP